MRHPAARSRCRTAGWPSCWRRSPNRDWPDRRRRRTDSRTCLLSRYRDVVAGGITARTEILCLVGEFPFGLLDGTSRGGEQHGDVRGGQRDEGLLSPGARRQDVVAGEPQRLVLA